MLLDIDGVLQFPRPEFAEAIERDYRWRTDYATFQRVLFADPGHLATLVGDGDVLTVLDRILPEHVDGLAAEVMFDRWLAENIEINRTLVEVLPRLRVDGIFLASNQDHRRGPYVESLYRDSAWFTGSVLSHRLRVRKPDPQYFNRLLWTIDRTADACLFVDDTAPNVDAARSVGLDAIHYTDNAQLIGALRERGLISSVD